MPCWWGGSPEDVDCLEVSTDGIGTLAVAVLGGTDPSATPILYLSGGPGFATLGGVDEWIEDLGGFGGRGVVLVDQPGTGYSGPTLDCPERESALVAGYTDAAAFDVERERQEAAISSCRDRLEGDGVDLSGYDSAAIAAAIESAREALGFERWHVVGTSYGTAPAMELAAIGGSSVESLLLDGVYPPARTGATVFAERVAEGTRDVLRACDADPTCAAEHPDLLERFDAMVDQLDARPIDAEVDRGGGAPLPIRFTGADAAATLYFASWAEDTLAAVPLLVDSFERRDAATVASVAATGIDELSSLVEGTHYAIECRDRGADLDGDDVAAALAARPEASSALLAVHSYVTICPGWDAEPAPLQAPDRFDIWDTPTLVMSGELDPVTPAEWGADLAGQVDAHHVVVPGRPHVNWTSGECTRAIVGEFWDDPGGLPDTSCLDTLPGPAWLPAP